MIEIVLTPGPDAPPGSMCPVHVAIRNDGPEVEIDNPAALLHQPRWRATQLPAGAPVEADNWQNFVPPDGQTPRILLAPCQLWEADVMLRLPAPDAVPGEWEVVLLVDTPDGLAESAPCVLRIQDWQIAAGHAGYGRSASGDAEGDVLLVQSGVAGTMLYRMPWREDDSDRTGHGGEMPVPLQPAGVDAQDPLVPVRDAPFWKDSARWLLWREGAVIHALDTVLSQLSLTLPAPPEAVLRPALQRDGGPIELAVLAPGRTRIDVLSFPREADGTPAIAGHIDLPLPAAAGAAGFAPGGGTLFAVSADSADGVVLLLHQAGGNRDATMAGATLLPGAAPAIGVTHDHAVIVAALVTITGEIAIARARFDAFPLQPVEVTRIGVADGGIAEAALLLLTGHETAEAERDAVVVLRLGDGTLMSLGREGTLTPTEFEAPPVSPLTLAPGAHGGFILACDPRLGPFMAEA